MKDKDQHGMWLDTRPVFICEGCKAKVKGGVSYDSGKVWYCLTCKGFTVKEADSNNEEKE